MTIWSDMTERVQVYERTVETDTWTPLVGGRFPASVSLLNPSAARRESVLLEPEVTHTVRVPFTSVLKAGQRLLVLSDRAEYVIRYVRPRMKPRPGFVVCGCASEKAVLS